MQQRTQYGFEQFQKLTLTNLRDYSEDSYQRQFLQLDDHLHYVECRFSPKKTIGKTTELLAKIFKGWEDTKPHTGEYALVAHFIKKKDSLSNKDHESEYALPISFIKQRTSASDTCWRYQIEYSDLCQRASALLTLINSKISFAERIVGIDAAGSEFDMPPSVFAPFFRALKRNGVKHATYHAGEDFYHILGGLRAIYEAIEFCGLSRGDRIGHASAIGLDPNVFTSSLQGGVPIPLEEYFDDLVFVYAYITEQMVKELYSLIPLITASIEKYCLRLYGKNYPIPSLIAAWRLRRFHPIMVLFEDSSGSDQALYYDDEEALQCLQERKGLPHEIYLAYQDASFIGRMGTEFVTDQDLFSTDELVVLQQSLLKYMHTKEIVIETLPSSNVSIGPHESIDSYHLWNWIRWENEGKCIPPIVVGTDDPGIFPTTIFNEYSCIYCHLVYSLDYSYEGALKIISSFEDNARIYRFYDKDIQYCPR